MSSDIINAIKISAMGMRAQGTRIRVITENVSNVGTTGTSPGADPYRRQTITFANEMNKNLDVDAVTVDEIGEDTRTPFPLKFMPDHPAADAAGYVKTPNVNVLVEMQDIREAQRSYEANLGMMEQARNMVGQTVDLLRN